MSIRTERKKARLTQAELALFSGVRQGTISKLESGAMLDPSFEILHKIAWALKKCGRRVDAVQLQPRRQPALIKGARALPKRRKAS